MDGLIAIACLMLGLIFLPLAFLYWEKGRDGVFIISIFTASFCFAEFFSRIQS